MDKLIVFNCILLLVIFAALMLCKKVCKTQKGKNIALVIAPLVTILFHYSAFLALYITSGEATEYLRSNPNLLLPIYPCNVVMWGCLVFGLLRNKASKFAGFLADYLFWFGIFSTLVGMFANVDFINNPTLKDFETTKSIVAHATLLFNILLLYSFGYVKVDLPRNLLHIAMSVVAMYIIGLYCNKMFEVFMSAEKAYSVNSMFILHSPFEAVPFLTYPTIAGGALALYFVMFAICELFAYPKGNRWISRLKKQK